MSKMWISVSGGRNGFEVRLMLRWCALIYHSAPSLAPTLITLITPPSLTLFLAVSAAVKLNHGLDITAALYQCELTQPLQRDV